MSVSASIDIPAFEELAELAQADTVLGGDIFQFTGNAVFWYLIPTLISPTRPESNFWPALTGVMAASAVSRGTGAGLGATLGLGTVTFLWLSRGDARLW